MTKTEEEGTSYSNGYKDLRGRICMLLFEEGNDCIRWESSFVCLKDY